MPTETSSISVCPVSFTDVRRRLRIEQAVIPGKISIGRLERTSANRAGSSERAQAAMISGMASGILIVTRSGFGATRLTLANLNA